MSFSTLMAGASISKIMLVFKQMGLSLYNIRTYFKHQSKFIFPATLNYWEEYQNTLLESIKLIKNSTWCGDARFDSAGHCAKFGVYTVINCNTMKIAHFELLQV